MKFRFAELMPRTQIRMPSAASNSPTTSKMPSIAIRFRASPIVLYWYGFDQNRASHDIKVLLNPLLISFFHSVNRIFYSYLFCN